MFTLDGVTIIDNQKYRQILDKNHSIFDLMIIKSRYKYKRDTSNSVSDIKKTAKNQPIQLSKALLRQSTLASLVENPSLLRLGLREALEIVEGNQRRKWKIFENSL